MNPSWLSSKQPRPQPQTSSIQNPQNSLQAVISPGKISSKRSNTSSCPIFLIIMFLGRGNMGFWSEVMELVRRGLKMGTRTRKRTRKRKKKRDFAWLLMGLMGGMRIFWAVSWGRTIPITISSYSATFPLQIPCNKLPNTSNPKNSLQKA